MDTRLNNDNRDNQGAILLVQDLMVPHKDKVHTVDLVKELVKCSNGDLRHNSTTNHRHNNKDRLLIPGRTLGSQGICKVRPLVQTYTRMWFLAR